MQLKSIDWCGCLANLTSHKHNFLLTKRKKSKSTTKAANTGNNIPNTLLKKQWRKKKEEQETKPIHNFEHATLFLGQVFFHRKPPMLLVFCKEPTSRMVLPAGRPRREKKEEKKQESHET